MGFLLRNSKSILQILLIGILIVAGVFMISSSRGNFPELDYNSTSYKPVYIGPGAENFPSETGIPAISCTPMEGANEKKSWAYSVNSLTDSSSVRMSYTYIGPDAYNGKPATLSKLTMDATGQENPVSFSVSLWSDPDSKACLGATMRSDSKSAFEVPINCEYVSTMFYGPLCRELMENYTSRGSEAVSVPAGVFNATVYTSSDGMITMWLSQEIPLPVKISASDAETKTEWLLLYYGDKK